jgi:MraZ protein
MAMFRGSFQHSIDHKGRVSVPARFRRLLSGEANDTFILMRGLEACVALYPLDGWRRMEERLQSRSFHDPVNRRFLRLMSLDLNEATMDSQGRVAIPPRLLAHASLQREVMMNGVLDHIEIWDPALFEKYVGGSDQTFEDMAGELLL